MTSEANGVRRSSGTLDRNLLMSQSQQLVSALGWTPTQGQQFLMDNYGKKGRHLLNDSEFVDFINKLESMQALDDEVDYGPDDVPY